MQEREDIDFVTAMLPDNQNFRIQVTSLGGQERVGNIVVPFEEITDVIKGISTSIVEALKKAKPRRSSVEFGLEIAVESGQLTTLLVKGSSSATLKITLEWGEDEIKQA